MLQIMLCGAADTGDVRDEFIEVVSGFGGAPLHYLSGEILYLNSRDSSWEANSRLTVEEADLCVFTVVRRFGRLTWHTELAAALAGGKPFLVLCLQETYESYLALTRSLSDFEALADADQRELVAILRELEMERALTIVPFRLGYYRDVLRRQLGTLFDMSLRGLESKNRRAGVARLFRHPEKLTLSDLALTRDIALDEFEDKNVRKVAIDALSTRQAGDDELVLGLVRSGEQGVARRAIERIPTLYPTKPIDRDFVDSLVAAANDSDDVGLARRLVPVLLELDLELGIGALADLSVADAGLRRRLAENLDSRQREIEAQGLTAEAATVLSRCLGSVGEPDWKQTARQLLGRWQADSPKSP